MLYRVAVVFHSVVVLMAFLKFVDSSDSFMKMNPVGLDLQICIDVYKGVLLLLPNSVVWFVSKATVRNIVSRTRFPHLLAHAAVLCSLESDCAQSDCPDWYHYQNYTADVVTGVDDAMFRGNSTVSDRSGMDRRPDALVVSK